MPKKILLADDSVTIQKVVELTFTEGDYQVTCVSNGKQALEKIHTQRPDILLCDVIMPELNGYEVAEAIKQNPALSSIPVILLTGTFEPFDEEKARRSGAESYVTKPFDSRMLIDKVEELLQKRMVLDTSAPHERADIISERQEYSLEASSAEEEPAEVAEAFIPTPEEDLPEFPAPQAMVEPPMPEMLQAVLDKQDAESPFETEAPSEPESFGPPPASPVKPVPYEEAEPPELAPAETFEPPRTDAYGEPPEAPPEAPYAPPVDAFDASPFDVPAIEEPAPPPVEAVVPPPAPAMYLSETQESEEEDDLVVEESPEPGVPDAVDASGGEPETVDIGDFGPEATLEEDGFEAVVSPPAAAAESAEPEEEPLQEMGTEVEAPTGYPSPEPEAAFEKPPPPPREAEGTPLAAVRVYGPPAEEAVKPPVSEAFPEPAVAPPEPVAEPEEAPAAYWGEPSEEPVEPPGSQEEPTTPAESFDQSPFEPLVEHEAEMSEEPAADPFGLPADAFEPSPEEPAEPEEEEIPSPEEVFEQPTYGFGEPLSDTSEAEVSAEAEEVSTEDFAGVTGAEAPGEPEDEAAAGFAEPEEAFEEPPPMPEEIPAAPAAEEGEIPLAPEEPLEEEPYPVPDAFGMTATDEPPMEEPLGMKEEAPAEEGVTTDLPEVVEEVAEPFAAEADESTQDQEIPEEAIEEPELPAMEQTVLAATMRLPKVEEAEVPEEEEAFEEPFAEEEPVAEEAFEEPISEEDIAAEETEPAEEPIAEAPPALTEEDLERMVRKVLSEMAPDLLREIAWEVIPELAETLIKKRIQDLESSVE